MDVSKVKPKVLEDFKLLGTLPKQEACNLMKSSKDLYNYVLDLWVDNLMHDEELMQDYPANEWTPDEVYDHIRKQALDLDEDVFDYAIERSKTNSLDSISEELKKI